VDVPQLVERQRPAPAREFGHEVERLAELHGIVRPRGIVSADRHSLQDREFGLTDAERASFDGIRFGNLLEALVGEVSTEGRFRELPL